MKILQINKYFYQKGGAETVFFNTIDLLENKGNIVIPFALKNEKNRKSIYDSYFVDFPELSQSGLIDKISNIPTFIYNKEAAKQLDKLLSKEKPDIAHIHLLFNSLSVSILPVLRKHRIPVVMTAHDYRLVCPAYTITDGKGEVCERCLENGAYWHCITNKCSKGNLINSVLLSADSYFRKYFYSPTNYVDHFIFVSRFSRNKHIQAEKRFEPKSSQLYNFTLVEQDAVVLKSNYILFFGRISNEKGIPTLIDAVKDTSIKLKVVGDGPLLMDLKQHESENIEFLGFKFGDELKQYIQNARYVVVPSECYENNPMTIIESMTLGTPVIGSNLGGIPELIDDTKTGFLFETKSSSSLREAILKALNYSPSEYKSMSEAAMKYAKENFSPETHFEKLIDIYTSTIQNYRY